MILTGSKLEEYGRALWGKSWMAVLGKRLAKTRQTIHGRSKSKVGLPKAFKRQLLAAAEDQLATVNQIVNDLREDVGP